MSSRTARPLAKALHTVTSCARIARRLQALGCADLIAGDSAALALLALDALGYTAEQVHAGDPALFAACVAAVAKGA